jgi:hypothetical protein
MPQMGLPSYVLTIACPRLAEIEVCNAGITVTVRIIRNMLRMSLIYIVQNADGFIS